MRPAAGHAHRRLTLRYALCLCVWVAALHGAQCRSLSPKPSPKASSKPPPQPPPKLLRGQSAVSPPPPADPPPPAPNAQPTGFSSIKVTFGGYYAESNLCNSVTCAEPARAELLVKTSNSSSGVWAPLCAVDDDAKLDAVARLVCNQFADWPDSKDYEMLYDGMRLTTNSYPGDPFTIPSADDVPNATLTEVFKTASVAYWATISNFDNIATARSVQDLPLKISDKPCASGLLFSLTCDTVYV